MIGPGQVNPQQFSEYVKFFGVPGAMLLTLLICVSRGIGFVTRREYDAALQRGAEAERHCDERTAEFRAEIIAIKLEYEKRLVTLREEKNYWRETAIKNLQVADRATQTSEAAVRVVEAHTPKPPPDGE